MIRLTKTALFILVPLFLALYASPAKAQTKVYRYTHIGNQNFHANNPYKAAQYYLKVLKKMLQIAEPCSTLPTFT